MTKKLPKRFSKFLSKNNIIVSAISEAQAERYSFECDDGWLKLIQRMMEELLNSGWDGKFQQCKEKFGMLRFYSESANDEIVQKYCKESQCICEICGKPGILRQNSNYWIKTLCDKHANQLKFK